MADMDLSELDRIGPRIETRLPPQAKRVLQALRRLREAISPRGRP